MKLLASLGLAAVFALALVGCGSSKGPGGSEGGSDGLTIGIVYDKGGLGDKSFNDSANAGIEKAKSELGVKVVSIESKEVKDYESNLRELADRGCDLVFAIGFNMQNAAAAVAKEFPDTKFAIVDGFVDSPNARSLSFREEEGSFLVGYLAGLMSKSRQIGFVGGENIDLIHKFEYGYYAGAITAYPQIGILPAKYTGSWDDIDTAKVSANILYNDGADIVYHAAGRAGLGVIRAAKDHGTYAIGVDSDQDHIEPGSVLTSMIKRVDVAVFSTIQDLKDGKFTSGVQVYDLKSEGVGTSEFTYTKLEIGEENVQKLEDVKRRIISGEIVVPKNKQEFQTFQQAVMAAKPTVGR